MPEAYVLYPRRFAILAAFSANNALNACIWIAFASVASIVQERFKVSASAVNSLSLVFMLAYIPGSVAAAYCLERFGLRVTLIAGAALNALCAWVRYGGCFIDNPTTAFAVVMIGQILGAISQVSCSERGYAVEGARLGCPPELTSRVGVHVCSCSPCGLTHQRASRATGSARTSAILQRLSPPWPTPSETQ